MARRKGTTDILFLARNIRFIMRNFLVAGRKAEENLKRSAEVARSIGAIGILGQAFLGLGLLYKEKGKPEEAETYLLEAIKAFEKCGAAGYLTQAKEALAACEISSGGDPRSHYHQTAGCG